MADTVEGYAMGAHAGGYRPAGRHLVRARIDDRNLTPFRPFDEDAARRWSPTEKLEAKST
jgi:hypothetical protein